MKKPIFFAIIFAVFGFIGFEYFKVSSGSDSKQLYGNVDIREVNLSFRVAGRLENMLFDEGDIIPKGEIVARLDAEPFQDEVKAAKAEVDAAEAINTNAQKTYERAKELFEKGTGSETDFDDASAQLLEAQARVNVAKAKLELVETHLSDTVLAAPSDGTIINRVHEVGAIVNFGEPVYTLALNTPIWIRTYVSEEQLGTIYPGMKAQVMTDSGHKYNGKIGFISPQAEFTPKNVETQSLRTDLVYRLRIVVTNADDYLRQGMPVTITLIDDKQTVQS